MIKDILYIVEPISILLLLIIIFRHCQWYGFNYKMKDGDNPAEKWKVFGMNNTQISDCNLDDSEVGIMISKSITLGTILYLLSILCRFIKPFKIFGDYLHKIGFGLILLSITSLGGFILFRETFTIENVYYEFTGTSFRPGYWFALTCTILLIIANVML